jgi:hypothetical protein
MEIDWSDAEQRTFALLPGEHRVRLLDEAVELVRRYRRCPGRCAIDCPDCLASLSAHLSQLLARDARQAAATQRRGPH